MVTNRRRLEIIEAIMTGSVQSKQINPNRNDMIRQKGSQGRFRQFKGTSSNQSLKQRAANKDRAQTGSLRSYGKGKFSLKKAL